MKGRIAVDFDGVIHQYTTWQGNPPTGKPVVGVRHALKRLTAAGYELVCFTAREANYVMEWLEAYDLKVFFCRITNTKTPDIIAFFDDRAFHVESNRHNGLQAAIEAFMEAKMDDGDPTLIPTLVPAQQRLVA